MRIYVESDTVQDNDAAMLLLRRASELKLSEIVIVADGLLVIKGAMRVVRFKCKAGNEPAGDGYVRCVSDPIIEFELAGHAEPQGEKR